MSIENSILTEPLEIFAGNEWVPVVVSLTSDVLVVDFGSNAIITDERDKNGLISSEINAIKQNHTASVDGMHNIFNLISKYL